MSLNRELKDFLGAFSASTSALSNVARIRAYKNRGGIKNFNDPTNPGSDAGKWVNSQAGAVPTGAAPMAPMSPQPMSFSQGQIPGQGQLPMAPDMAMSDVDPGDQVAQDVAGGDMEYAGGGEVELPPDSQGVPPYEEPGSQLPFDPNAAAREPPIPLPSTKPSPRTGAVDTSAGNMRKGLSDQTRTEAYDPSQDGPLPVGAVPAGGGNVASPPASAVPTRGQTPASGMTGATDRGLSSNNARSDLENALHGAMTFAQQTFHLNDPNDPHHAGGKQALFSGMGAATPDVVKAMDDKVNKGVPADPQLYAVRRLEAIYRWYSMNGKTAEANKAAFELVQFTAGVAAQWGDRASKQLQSGDMQGAIKSVQEGYNYIPDGRHMEVQGNTATIIDKRTGKPVDQFQFTPQQVFGAAMGLSNRSMYWQVLAQRAGGAGTKASNRTDSQQDLDRARAENVRARTQKLKGGGVGAPGHSAAFSDLVNKINAEEPDTAPKGSAPPQQAAPVSASASAPEPEPGMADGEATAAPDTQDQPVTSAGPNLTPAPQSVLRTQPPAANQGTPAPVTDVGPSVRIPPRDDHPGFEPHYEAPDRVPEHKIAHDGEKYVPGSDVNAAQEFTEEAPKANPYRKYEADAAKVPGKEGVALRQLLQRKAAAYDANVKGYTSRKKAFDQGEKQRVAGETKAAGTDLKKAMAHYDQSFKPHELKKSEEEVTTAWDTLAKKAVYSPGKTFEDPNSSEAKADAAANKANFDASIFGDKTVSADKLRGVAVSLMTSNPNMTADKAMRLVYQLSAVDPEDATKRTYKPVGRDVTASKNVVVAPAEGGPHKFAPVHIRPDAYADLTSIVQGRLKAAAKRGKEGAEAAAIAAEGDTSEDSKKLIKRVVDPLKSRAASIADRATTIKPAGDRGLIEDVRRGAVGLGDTLRRGVGAIPGGSGVRINEMIRDNPQNYPSR